MGLCRPIAVIVMLALPLTTDAQLPPVQPAKKMAYVAPENAALWAAREDAKQFAPHDLPYLRWVMLHGDLEAALRRTALAVWYLQVTAAIKRPVVVNERLVRIDCRYYASRAADLKRWVDTFEENRFDPAFSLNLDESTRKFNVTAPGIKVRIKSQTPGLVNGKIKMKTTYKEVDALDVDDAVVRVPSPHLDLEAWTELALLTDSEAPVVDYEYFCMRALRTIKDSAVNKSWATIYGGLYYDYKGITTGNKEGTDEDNFLEKFFGIGSVKAKQTQFDVFGGLRSDLRTITNKSNVTGGDRRTDIYDTLTGGKYIGKVMLTRDLKRANRADIAKRPRFNVLSDGIHDGVEAIGVAANGSHVFYIGDGAGKRVDAVPSDLAADTTIPKGESQDLEGPLGCLCCHGPERGIRTIKDDFRERQRAKVGPDRLKLDLFPDKSDDEVDRVAGLFRADLEDRVFPRLRDDYAAGMLEAGGPWKAAKADQSDIVEVASSSWRDMRQKFFYDMISPERALDRLGVAYEKGKAAETLEKLLPPVKLVVETPASQRVPEDPDIADLKEGTDISRYAWDRVRSVIATRIKDNIK